MKIVQIQDKHIIRKDSLPSWKQKLYDGNGYHLYVMYDEKYKNKTTRKLLATSHYYDPDKVTKLKKNDAILMKFKGLKSPTTVTNVRYLTDINKKQLKYFKDYKVVSTVSNYQEKRILSFLNKAKRSHLMRPFLTAFVNL